MEVRVLERESGLWGRVYLGEVGRNFERKVEEGERIEEIWENWREFEGFEGGFAGNGEVCVAVEREKGRLE